MPGQIRIKNPGAFPPGVTPEAPQHKPRNPLLMSYLYDLGYVERYGFGITRIREACASHPLTSVAIETSGLRTKLVFTQRSAEIDLDSIDREILVLLGGHTAGAKELTQHLGISRQALNKRIRAGTPPGCWSPDSQAWARPPSSST